MSRAAAICGIVLLALMAIGASPAPATDLSEVLAGPPAPDYTELPASATVLDGAYDLDHYVNHLSGVPFASARAELSGYGFQRAYARTWLEPVKGAYVPGWNPRRLLSEVVEEYNGADGAQARFDEVKALSTAAAASLIDSTSIPSSYAVMVNENTSFDELFQTVFVKGNAVYTVGMLSATDDLTQAMLVQAQAEFATAPPFTIPPGQPTVTRPAAAVNGAPFNWRLVAFTALGLGTAVLVLAVALYQRRNEARDPTWRSVR